MGNRDQEAYAKFLTKVGIGDQLLKRLSYAQIDDVNSALKCLPPSTGLIPRYPFDVIRLSYGFYGKKFSLRIIGEIYSVSAGTISMHIEKIQKRLANRRNPIIKNIFYPPAILLKDLSFKDKLATSVDELDLSTRTNKCLINAGIKTIYELIILSELSLLRTQNFGRKNLNELKGTLTEIELCLNMNEEYCQKRIKAEESER